MWESERFLLKAQYHTLLRLFVSTFRNLNIGFPFIKFGMDLVVLLEIISVIQGCKKSVMSFFFSVIIYSTIICAL